MLTKSCAVSYDRENYPHPCEDGFGFATDERPIRFDGCTTPTSAGSAAADATDYGYNAAAIDGSFSRYDAVDDNFDCGPSSRQCDCNLHVRSGRKRHVRNVVAKPRGQLQLDDAGLVRFLLWKLDAMAYEKYANYTLPKQPGDLKFDETISILKDIFGPRMWLFNQRYHCLKLVRNPRDDSRHMAASLTGNAGSFIWAKQSKCLIFVCELQSPADAEYRLH
uniref:DUF7083 domain-containing protein n=1 Tax=Ascaris lumbricoides TaxID=6252 RepID=A0A0M3I8A3_ASCLU